MTGPVSTGGARGAAAPRPTGSPFVELSPEVLVDPDDVAAITQHKHYPEDSVVWIRGLSTAGGIRVHRPLVEVVAALAAARAHAGPH